MHCGPNLGKLTRFLLIDKNMKKEGFSAVET
jgi:hypothetical protein